MGRHPLKARLIGVLEHEITKKLSHFTMTEKHDTGANHINEGMPMCLATK